MTLIPITPIKLDPSELLFINQLYDISLSCSKEDLGVGVLKIMLHSEKKLLVLLFNDQQKIILASNSKAWLEENEILIPQIQGGLWKLQCSNQKQLAEIQDIFTLYIKYENRHHLKNTLAIMDPNGQVTQVADNVTIDLDYEDFIESQEKVPVYVHSTDHVRFVSGDTLKTGSDWMASALVFTGQTLAQGISSGSRMIQEKIAPSPTPFHLSEQDKQILDIVHRTTHNLSDATTQALQNFFKGFQIPQPTTHLGWSTFWATATLLDGLRTATGIVLASSRQGITQLVQKKYGSDAGYLAEKTMGSVSHVAHLVYFDAKGISRTVILGGKQDMFEKRETIFDDQEALFEQHAVFEVRK
ncbi:hypothetical protein G6F56_001595 [Rhizopus delemar]|uniref:Senescence domain-containing protein n=1 Tax=Rhizopus stolonifer TaxID=4846 RepID=A0A367KYB1_RHIST|nr:hypothetical protein G6F56_001595 [Rhizopus delemar]RCI07203.1 hypothetical protein CU098_004773 [Rhizopus stolonifer]